MVKCLPEFEYFYAFLKNKNIIFKIRRSKVTDYAALKIKTSIINKCHSSSATLCVVSAICCKTCVVLSGVLGEVSVVPAKLGNYI